MASLVLRLFFKACLPVMMVVGVMSYAMHLQGGDPAGLLSRVAGGALTDLVSGTREAATRASATVNTTVDTVARRLPASDAQAATRDQPFYTWVDAEGVTHFSSSDPQRNDATIVTVDPDANLIAGVPASDTGEGRADAELAVPDGAAPVITSILPVAE